MKSIVKQALLAFISIFIINICYSQDIIIFKSGDEIKSKVLEVAPELIKYKKWENQNGPIYSSAKTDIFMIKYANGTKEVFKPAATSNPTQINATNSTKEQTKSDSTEDLNFKKNGAVRINEPMFDGMVVYVNDTIGNGITLEKKESNKRDPNDIQNFFNPYSSKVGSVGYVKNCCSNVRIKQGTNLVFLLPYAERVEPNEYIKIFKLKKEKKTRSIKQYDMKVHAFGDPIEKDLDKDYIKFTYQKYGKRSYLITIDKLEPGEYAITINSDRTGMFHLFGIE